MKLLMAVSSDGFLATGPDDAMRWTGVTDKAIFRLLTLTTSDRPILVGRRTAGMLPRLHGRTIKMLSRHNDRGLTLEDAEAMYPEAWLIGGPTIALEALRLHLVTLAVLCQVPATLYQGISVHEIAARLPVTPAHSISIGEIEVKLFIPHAGEA